MAHDAEEAKQDVWLAEEREAVADGRYLAAALRFFDIGHAQGDNCKSADNGIDREEHAPVESEGRDECCRAPHGDIRSEERSDGLDKLSEGQSRGKAVGAHYGSDERIERRLHQCVADAEKRECYEHHGIAVSKQRYDERCHGDKYREEHCLLATNLVHQHSCRYREDEKPEEHKRWHYARFAMGQAEVFLNIVGCNADKVNETHREEAEHHRDQY